LVLGLKPANDLDAIVLEDFLFVRRIGEFAGQVLAGEVQQLVQAGPPLGAISNVVDNSPAGNESARTPLAGVAPQLAFIDDPIRRFHGLDYTVDRAITKKPLPIGIPHVKSPTG